LWTRTYGTTGVDFGYAVVSTIDGGWALAGSITVSGQSLNMMLTKIDDDGDIIWERSYGGSNVDEAFGLQYTSDGGFLWAGARFPGEFTARYVHGSHEQLRRHSLDTAFRYR